MPIYGPRWPLKVGREDTYELNVNLKSQINYNLKCVLLTHPGENISDPSYGVGLHFFLFELNNGITRDEIIRSIEEQVSYYVPQIFLKEVIIESDSADIDENSLVIKIIYSIENQVSEFVLEMGDVGNIGYT